MAKPFVERIERTLQEKKTYCDGCAIDIKAIYEEAEEFGLPVKALKRIVRLRKLERDIEALPEKLDIDEQAQFSALAEAFGNTPFGEHARLRASLAALARDGATVEVRHPVPPQEDVDHINPQDLIVNEPPRDDAEYLARIGRGHDAFDEPAS